MANINSAHKYICGSMKKKIIVSLILLVGVLFNASASTGFSAFKGVWSSDNAEAVLTDSICIFYYKADSTMQAILEIPSAGISSRTVFKTDGTVISSSDIEPLKITQEGRTLRICGYSLKKVEDIRIVEPYEMEFCKSKFDVGECLQQWRLGAGYGVSDDMLYCEINTNRHMFVYMINPSMVYIRAAATRNNNNGTLFFQNIRMMKNRNTDEFTMNIVPDNYNCSRNDLEIDNTKFQPNSCTFSTDGGIYWSLISFEPNRILINGCGETYKVERPSLDPECEWIEYVPYSTDDKLLRMP